MQNKGQGVRADQKVRTRINYEVDRILKTARVIGLDLLITVVFQVVISK
jgi:hypothetical protein